MSWKDLLQKEELLFTAPWFGGPEIRVGTRRWSLQHRPPEHGWYRFCCWGRTATWTHREETNPEILVDIVRGYLAGDRLIPDDIQSTLSPQQIAKCERVWFVEEGLERFSRVSAGRSYAKGPLVFRSIEMPLGPEPDVLRSFLNKEDSLKDIPGVVPALEATFRLETWHRAEADKRRAELEQRRREEEEMAARERRRQEIVQQLGDGAHRREMAQLDFAEACRASLSIGGAEYLDHRATPGRRNEMVVTFRLDRRMFQCVCDQRTLRIIDAGVCLTDEETGERGDTRFTLESLPAVIREAARLGRLVVFRHVG